MNTLKTKFISLGLVVILLSSCTNLLYTSLDVLRPAKVAFDADVHNLLLVNNTVVQPVEYGHTTQLINQNPKKVLINTDSLSIFCVSALSDEMQSKDFFTKVTPIINSINSSENFSAKQLFNSEKVKSLCNEYDADVILSLDKIKVNDDLNEYYDNEFSRYLASLEVKIETEWSVYYKNNSRARLEQFKDTLYWEGEDYGRTRAMNQLPVRSDALIDAAITVGRNSINRFVPYWEKTDRYFYNPSNKVMKQAMDSVYVKNWTFAIDLWKSAFEKTKSNWLKSQAANNIAIAYEILGDLDKAFEYAATSYTSLEELTLVDYDAYVRIVNYLSELNQRRKDVKLLKVQLGEN